MTGADDNTALSSENLGDVFADIDQTVDAATEPTAEKQIEPEAAQAEPAQTAQPSAQSDAVPAWRLREEAEGRRQAEARAAQIERQLEELRRSQEAAKPKPEIWDDPNAFIEQNIKRNVDPIQQQMTQMREQYSQMMAIQQHGADKVQAAFAALDQAAKAGDPEALMVVQRVKTNSMHPFGDIMNWHNRQSVFTQVGGDLEAYKKKLTDEAREAALKDPEFVQKAIESARANARPVIRPPQAANVTKLPSLNRGTAAADDDEPEDMGDVLNQAFGGR
jgi:hypothetical protein